MIRKLPLHFMLRMPWQHVWLWTLWTSSKVILLHLVQNSSDRWKTVETVKSLPVDLQVLECVIPCQVSQCIRALYNSTPSANGTFETTVYVHRVLLQIRANCYRCLWDISTSFKTGNNKTSVSVLVFEIIKCSGVRQGCCIFRKTA
jgi:hypothetical protein